MSVAAFPEAREVRDLLEGLLGRDCKVTTTDAASATPHEATLCGLVDDENTLRFVLGTDLLLAHLLGASVALIPAGRAKDATGPDDDLLANYHEVANVLSRTVNERAGARVRIDPGMQHEPGALAAVVAGGPVGRYAVEVAGYGAGVLVVAAA
jgi:hypothetical protein